MANLAGWSSSSRPPRNTSCSTKPAVTGAKLMNSHFAITTCWRLMTSGDCVTSTTDCARVPRSKQRKEMIHMSNNQNNHAKSQGKPMLRPAIIIGPGGTGNQVVRRLKKFVQDQYGATPSLLGFLVIDTDESTFNDQNWAPLPALGDNEKLSLYDSQVPFMDVRDNPGAYPEIHDWLPSSLDVGLL